MNEYQSIVNFKEHKNNMTKTKVPDKSNGKKVLVIHPFAFHPTRFLEPIYAKIPDKTVITGGKTKEEICELIRSHDRILMMGHGGEDGLLAMGRFPAPIPI